MYENEVSGIFTITRLGLNLITKWGVGIDRIIGDVWVGSGRLADGDDITEFTDLIEPIAQATTTVPQAVDNQIQFITEYRIDLNPELDGFYLNEFGVFAIDPDLGRILLLYGNLLNFPEWIPPYSGVRLFNSRRLPTTIGLSGDGKIILTFPANAFVTSGDVATFVEIELNAHNQDPNAHENRFGALLTQIAGLQNTIASMSVTIGALTDEVETLTQEVAALQGFNAKGPFATVGDIPEPYVAGVMYLVGTESPYEMHILVDGVLKQVGSTDINIDALMPGFIDGALVWA